MKAIQVGFFAGLTSLVLFASQVLATEEKIRNLAPSLSPLPMHYKPAFPVWNLPASPKRRSQMARSFTILN